MRWFFGWLRKKRSDLVVVCLRHRRYGDALLVRNATKALWHTFDAQIRQVLPTLRRKGTLIYRLPHSEMLFAETPYAYTVKDPYILACILTAIAQPANARGWHVAPIAAIAKVETTVFEPPSAVPYAMVKVRPLQLCFILPFPIPPARVALDITSAVAPSLPLQGDTIATLNLIHVSETLRRIQLQRLPHDTTNIAFQILLYWLLAEGRKQLLEDADMIATIQQTLSAAEVPVDEEVKQLVGWLMLDKMVNAPQGLSTLRRIVNDVTNILVPLWLAD